MKTSQSAIISQKGQESTLDSAANYVNEKEAPIKISHFGVGAHQSVNAKSVRPMKSMVRVKSVRPSRIISSKS